MRLPHFFALANSPVGQWFVRLMRRGWPFWLPCLLLLLWPPTREVAVDGVVDLPPSSPIEAALDAPEDAGLQFAAQLWANHLEEQAPYGEETTPREDKFLARRDEFLLALKRRFPRDESLDIWFRARQIVKQSGAKRLTLLESAQRAHPDNAYFFLMELNFRGRQLPEMSDSELPLSKFEQVRDDAPTIARMIWLLRRASRCTRYDEGTRGLKRRAFASWSRAGSWTLKQKLNFVDWSTSPLMMRQSSVYWNLPHEMFAHSAAERAWINGAWMNGSAPEGAPPPEGADIDAPSAPPPTANNSVASPRFRAWMKNVAPDDPRLKVPLDSLSRAEQVELAVALLRLQNLLDSSSYSSLSGVDWRYLAWFLATRTPSPRGNPPIGGFARAARVVGRPELAREIRTLFAERATLTRLETQLNTLAEKRAHNAPNASWSSLHAVLPSWALWAPTWTNLLALCSFVALGFAGVASLFLCFARPVPAAHPRLVRSATAVSLVMTLFFAGSAWLMWALDSAAPSAYGPQSAALVNAALAVCAPVFIAALWVQISTLWGQRCHFCPDLQSDDRFRVAPPFFGSWLLLVAYAVAVVGFLLSWAALCLDVCFDWPALALVFDGQFQLVEWVFVLAPMAVYLGGACCLLLLGWFFGWRFSRADAPTRAIWHGALETWKRSCFALAVVFSWAMLAIALSAWPARTAAHGLVGTALESEKEPLIFAFERLESN